MGYYNYNRKYEEQEHKQKYEQKQLMTECEKGFYRKISKYFGSDYIIQPQIPLSSIVKKNYDNYYASELFRTIDFGIFDIDDMNLKLLIEINDQTHNTAERRERDIKVKKILEEAQIPLVTFWTNQPNKNFYIVKTINKKLGKGKLSSIIRLFFH